MRHRRIGSTDLVASEVGLAVWSLVAGEGARSDEDASGVLGAALDLGVAYFEATDSDDGGRAEELVGQAVRGRRDEVTVATAFGYDTTPRPWDPPSAGPRHDWSAEFAGRALDRSLQRLRLEPVDLWLLHHPGMDAIESDELFELLESQVEKGKVRHYGVLLGPGPGWGDEGAAALGERRVAAVETVYNLAEQSPGGTCARWPPRPGPACSSATRWPHAWTAPPGPAWSSWSGTGARPSTRRCSGSPLPTRRWPPPCPRSGTATTWPSWPERPTSTRSPPRTSTASPSSTPEVPCDPDWPERGPVRAGDPGDPRRGELARAGLRGGRRHAPVLRRRAGAVPLGR